MYKIKKAIFGYMLIVLIQLIGGVLYADDPNIAREMYLGKALLGINYSVVTQRYDVYNSDEKGWHPGIDYRAKIGSPVYSPVYGIVDSYDMSEKGMGRLTIRIGNSHNFLILLHLSGLENNIKKGVAVRQGELIAHTGATGTKAPHLHVELREGKQVPTFYFKSKGQTGVNICPSELILLRVVDMPVGREIIESCLDGVIVKPGSSYSGWLLQTDGKIMYHNQLVTKAEDPFVAELRFNKKKDQKGFWYVVIVDTDRGGRKVYKYQENGFVQEVKYTFIGD